MALCRKCIHKEVCKICEELGTKNAMRMFDFNCENYIYSEGAWEYNRSAFNNKLVMIERYCEYGLTHFCDGTVNKSQADPEEQAKPPCPKYEECEIRKKKLEEIPIDSDKAQESWEI